MHSTVSWRMVPSGCMSGTLGDVLMFPSRNFPATLEMSEMSEDKDAAADKEFNFIEWQILRDGVHMNTGRPKPNESECRLPIGHASQKHGMTPAASPWDCGRTSMEGRVVNYLRSFGPTRSDSSSCSVDDQLGGMRRTLDGQLVNSVMRSQGNDGAQVTERVEDYGAESPGLSNRILAPTGSSAQLFGRGLMAQPTTKGQGQQIHRSQHHGIRNLFPEQSSGFSSVISQGSLELGNAVNEHVHLQKKPRRYDFIDGPGPLSQTELDSIHPSEAQYRNSYTPRGTPLASQIDPHPYKIPTTPFSSSLPDRPTHSYNSNILLQDLSLSTFQVASPPLPHKTSIPSDGLSVRSPINDGLSVRSPLNDGLSVQSPLVDYGYSVQSKLEDGLRCVPQNGFLISDGNGFKPLNLMDGPSQPTVSRDFMQTGSLGQVCSVRQPLETGSRAAWPAGFINFPSTALEGSSGCVITNMSQRRSLLDLEHREAASEEREGHRIHPISESQMRLVIQKQLTTTDVGSLGRIILPKKEAETHLPHLPDKEGIEMGLYDFDVDRTWIMKYRFWPNNKSRMYLLENTGEFAKFHSLQQGDVLLIYRQLHARYVLRVKKMVQPLRLVTPSQSISESGGAEDLVSAGVETGSSRALTSSASSRTLTSSASKEVCGPSASTHRLDVPDFSYAEATSSGSHRAQIVVEGRSQNLIGNLSKQAKASDDRNHNYMAQPAGTATSDDPTELDGESVYNLEEFPSLIEAEEIIGIFPLDSDSSEAQPSPVEIQVVRKTHAHMRAG